MIHIIPCTLLFSAFFRHYCAKEHETINEWEDVIKIIKNYNEMKHIKSSSRTNDAMRTIAEMQFKNQLHDGDNTTNYHALRVACK